MAMIAELYTAMNWRKDSSGADLACCIGAAISSPTKMDLRHTLKGIYRGEDLGNEAERRVVRVGRTGSQKRTSGRKETNG